MTTNGSRLAAKAEQLKQNGLARLWRVCRQVSPASASSSIIRCRSSGSAISRCLAASSIVMATDAKPRRLRRKRPRCQAAATSLWRAIRSGNFDSDCSASAIVLQLMASTFTCAGSHDNFCFFYASCFWLSSPFGPRDFLLQNSSGDNPVYAQCVFRLGTPLFALKFIYLSQNKKNLYVRRIRMASPRVILKSREDP